MTRVLLLGGTTEAGLLAKALGAAGIDAVYSWAGRTRNPVTQPIPTRTGGFGGIDGLAACLREGGFSHVVDATHPFAARISSNAAAACTAAGIPLCALERPPWVSVPGDRWQSVPDVTAAVEALPIRPGRVFLAIGRQALEEFAAKPQHFYLLRLIDAPEGELPFPNTAAIIGRGPFTFGNDRRLLLEHEIDVIVAKNGGSAGARAKIDAARDLGLPVIMIGRPDLPERKCFSDPLDVMDWLGHGIGRGTDRGV